VGGGWLARSGFDGSDSPAGAAASARAVNGQVEIVRNGETSDLSQTKHQPVRMHDLIKTGSDSGARLSTSSGAAIRLASSTELSLVPAGGRASAGDERIRLTQGRVDVEVSKRAPGHTFSVSTPDALVVVHGTRFTVEVSRAKPGMVPVTSVRVTEGKVSVRNSRGAAMLEAGSSWRSATPDDVKTARAEPADDSHARQANAVPAASSTVRDDDVWADSGPPRPTSLTEENRIYQAAMQAKQLGRDAAMVRYLDRLLARYPKSPLAPDARVARFRALQRLGRAEEAARSARKYLAEHPEGFASQEARDVALGRAPTSSNEVK